MRIVTFATGSILAGLLLAACGGGAPIPLEVPEDQARRVVGHDQSDVNLAAGAGVTAQPGSERKPDDGPYIVEMWLHPDPPLSHQALRADPRVDNPAKGYLEIRYQWRINGQELMGQTADTLPASEFGKGDVLAVEVTAKDVNGRTDAHRFGDIRVANSKPVVTSRIGAAGSLDGFQFRAEDPDGDKVTWRLEGAPRGVSIGRTSGTFRIASGQHYKAGAYTISVIASDGDGAEGSLTFDAALSGGQRAELAYKETPDQVTHESALTDQEYFERSEGIVEKIDQMTDEEWDAALERSLISEEEAEAAAATEVGADVTPTATY